MMDVETKDPVTLRKYLLGDASLEEQEDVELWLMSHEDAYCFLEAAEDDLIDDSLAGTLTGRELVQFNNYFLAAPERQRKVHFSRSLQKFIDVSTRARPDESFWTRLLNGVRYPSAFGYVLAALVVLMAVGGGWSVFKIAELQRQLHSATGEVVNLQQARDRLQKELSESQAAIQTLQTRVQNAQDSQRTGRRSETSATPVLVASLLLMPGRTRSVSEVPKITIGPETKSVKFSLALLDDDYATYRAVLFEAGRPMWEKDKIPATATRDGKAVVFEGPIDRLTSGDYSFSLMGNPNAGPRENINSYYFRVVRNLSVVTR
jgi:hypothetical protein